MANSAEKSLAQRKNKEPTLTHRPSHGRRLHQLRICWYTIENASHSEFFQIVISQTEEFEPSAGTIYPNHSYLEVKENRGLRISNILSSVR